MIYALYDKEDRPLGSFTREQFERLLNTSKNSFLSTIGRLHSGKRKHIYYKGETYRVYMYKVAK